MKDNQVFFKIMVQDETISNMILKTKLIGTEGTRLLREKRVEGRPRMRLRRGWTARGKRVHGVEFNKWMVEISLDWMVLKMVVLLL
ncbi:hypothetical protein AB9M93_14165 [Peribacillus frigoritolerans]|uniref:hypothetical protein n=1 Tax=Peribacillus frigoritolerans TaxID=450367 RepID=UPI003513E7AE